MVKAMPNKAIVDARVRKITKTEDPHVFLADMELLSSKSVAGYPNFAERFVGKAVQAKLFLRRKGRKISPDRKIRLVMKYEGDEHGGSFLAEEA